jgi:nucleoside-diphosphate-sugar epimerase
MRQVEKGIPSTAIFMTGCTGYLGSHLLRGLLKLGFIVYGLRRAASNLDRVLDLSSEVTWVDVETIDFNSFFATHQIDFVLHCATDYGRKQVDPSGTIEANLILPLKLLHAAAINGVSAFFNTDTILDKGVNNYSLSKKQFADWLESYSDRIIGINVALEHFYGPHDDPSKFVTYIIHSLLSNVEFIKLTEGRQNRDFIYIDDVISAFITLIKNAHTFKYRYYRFEVGSAQPVEIRSFVELAKEICHNDKTGLDFGAIPYRKNEVMSSEVNISGLTALGWRPEVSLLEGLQNTIEIEKKGKNYLCVI